MEFVSSPLPSDYIRHDPRIFFSYHPENTSFQKGFLGVSTSTVSGTLHIRSPYAVEVKNIALTFIGREVVEWGDLKKIKAEKIIFSQSDYLWEAASALGRELITDLDLPFSFDVPEDVVESFTSQFGKVQYTLKAIVNHKAKKKIAVEVKVPLCRWSIPEEQKLRPLIIRSNARHRKMSLSWQAILPRTFFDINSEVVIKLRLVSHNPYLRIRKISAYLKTYVNYTVKNHGVLHEKRHSKYQIYGKDIQMTPVGLDTEFESNVVVKISNSVPPTCKTKYTAVKNQIHIKVSLEKSRHPVMIIRDITVGRNFMSYGDLVEQII
ncbi:10368_t:CDS:1 [Acaulospora morrowiae]|uniref:10368_t:CDS:1 n=1 Tax=Acaulospora morrowiae TaxID=94023 RepID=A0A9N9N6S0_9GLOM|nr:10368_t:CDS:1 [Acaulospora morrowiae]